MSDPHGSARYDYDALGREARVVRTLDGVDYALERRHDAGGRLLGITFPDGDTVGTPTNPIQYDAAGRVQAIPGLVTSATYDALGRRRHASFANGAGTTWEYHDRGWVAGISQHVVAGGRRDPEPALHHGRGGADERRDEPAPGRELLLYHTTRSAGCSRQRPPPSRGWTSRANTTRPAT